MILLPMAARDKKQRPVAAISIALQYFACALLAQRDKHAVVHLPCRVDVSSQYPDPTWA